VKLVQLFKSRIGLALKLKNLLIRRELIPVIVAINMIDTTRLTEKQRQFIRFLQDNPSISSLVLVCEENKLDFNFIKGFILSGIFEGYSEITHLPKDIFILSSKGKKIGKFIAGYTLAQKLREENSLSISQLQQELGQDFYGKEFGALKKENVVEIKTDKIGSHPVLCHTSSMAINKFINRQEIFSAVVAGQLKIDSRNQSSLEWLVEERLIEKKLVDDYAIVANPEFQDIEIKNLVTTITNELLISGQWKNVEFKPYDICDEVPDISYGKSSILTQCIQKVRKAFLDMGFDEMSGQIVESSFWNFDALFTAQDHPAREIQDTFYLAKPQKLPLPTALDLIQCVKTVHEKSYGGIWSEQEASRAILRTHTTASTARNLYKLNGQDVKYFSIDKVFRNETIDKTHLAEFYQVEGVIVAPNLSVRDLIGYLSDFYKKLGFTKLKFKPTYNPYTEPSLEVYAYHTLNNGFIEIANSGVFRPEMLNSLGYEGKSTIAWGLGLERIAMLLYEVESLSELVGPGISLNPPQKQEL
jgi:phenylalanyl-tRNA synthetase alpha chain